jgi:hypothetical protein
VKTIDRKSVYRRGCAGGFVVGVLVGPALASLVSWRLSVHRLTEGPPPPGQLALMISLLLGGVFVGVAGGLVWAAVVSTLTSGESREFVRHAAPPAVFPGMFGNPGSDPFTGYKARIDAEEDGEPDAAPPAKMPESCPSCGKKLEGEPIAFCYHCGGELS